MIEKIKEQWIKALKSGKYTKCRGFLHSENDFCVIGVLCDLYLKSKGEEWRQESDFSEFSIHGSSFRPNVEILVWANLGQDNLNDLFNLNDRNKKTFNQMADWIEETL